MGLTLFFPPEAVSEEDEQLFDLQNASAWDVASRYHEFKARPSMKPVMNQLRRLSARAILQRAQAVMGSIVHPSEQRLALWNEVPPEADQPDIDIEETTENAVYPEHLGATEIWMTYRQHRKQSVVLAVDTSLSMTGEKLALTAVALAVVLLQFPDDPIGIVAFENEAKILKRPEERLSLQKLIERFLDVPAQGYTHLEAGLEASLELVNALSGRGHGRPASTVVITDGKYTAGRDPAYLAPKFPHLIVLKMGQERASLELCRELAQKGRGLLREVGEYEALPSAMYGVVKDLLRGA